MIRYFKPLLLLFCLVSVKIMAQNNSDQLKIFKYGKVPLSDFDTRPKGADSAAAAIKIFDQGQGWFEISPNKAQFIYKFERHVRYRVINKNAYNLADVAISFYNNGGSEEKLLTVKGATYNLNNGKIEISKMSSDAKFSNRTDKNHVLKKFTLPNVKEGSVIEYTYSTASDFIFALDDWYFQGSYPCEYSSFSLRLPQYYLYKTNVGGYIDINMLKPKEMQENYVIPATSTSNTHVVTATATINKYYATDIPAIKDETHITTLQDYIGKIGFELTGVNFPGSAYKDYSSTWPKIVSEMVEEEKFGRFIGRDNYEKGFLSAIIKDEKDSVQQMNLIFNYVKTHLKWDGKYGYYSQQTNQRAVMEKKSGNTGDINLCLLSLLNKAGLKSSPVLVSTRANGIHPGYPLATKFNTLIVQVEIGERQFLLDATDENNITNLISYQDLNHKGLKLDLEHKQATWISIENKIPSKSNIMYNLTLGEDNTFTGNLYLTSSNYEGLNRRNSYKSSATEAEFIKSYKSSKPGLEIAAYKSDNMNSPEEPLTESMDITIEDNVEDAGNLIYFNPMFYERTKENPFSLEERRFPVDFAYPFEENYRSIISFPASFKLEKLPKNEAFNLPDNVGSYSIIYSAEDHKIAVRSKISITKPVFSAEEYFDLKELYKNIVRKQAEQIVFKKL